MLSLLATCPRGAEPAVEIELAALGAKRVSARPFAVAFDGDQAVAYRACFWSRAASRVLLRLTDLEATDLDTLYRAAHAFGWEEHLTRGASFAIHTTVAGSSRIREPRHAALKLKDGLVDRLRELWGHRPDVDTDDPDLRIELLLHQHRASVNLDLGGPLHKRGYRLETVLAPLRENLAAAILVRAGWPAIATAGGALFDPMCGSGTFGIEAALMAMDISPRLISGKTDEGPTGWVGHDQELWNTLVHDGIARAQAGRAGPCPPILLADANEYALSAARTGVAAAGLEDNIRLENASLTDWRTREIPATGLMVVNPPYGERLGTVQEVEPLYRELGEVMRERMMGWKAAVLTGNKSLGLRIGVRARKRHLMHNGPIEGQLLLFDVQPGNITQRRPDEEAREPSEGQKSFENRLRKNLKRLRKWAKRKDIDCYRLYDADLPEYAVAVDIYGTRAHVQEYAPPSTIDPQRAKTRLREALRGVRSVLEMEREDVALKQRRRQRGLRQYERMGEGSAEFVVREADARYWVNLEDYLDTGLFLDHRPTRAMIRELARGRRFLNLFGYTGTATVSAALGGATASTTVDLSRTYLEWAERNFELNELALRDHELVQADVLAWLERWKGERYGLVFVDPPTFSNSKRMREVFDVQRDHVDLLELASKTMRRDGVMIFSTNHRKFRLDEEALGRRFQIRDLSTQTLPLDYERNPRIHRCYQLELLSGGRVRASAGSSPPAPKMS